MPDEFKTLLKIEGDASGAKKAAEETKAAAQSVGAAQQQVETQVAQATTQASGALEQKTEKAGKAKSGFDKLAESMGVTRQQANEFREVVTRMNPELGALLDIAYKGEGVFKTLFTGIGAAALTAVAAIAMVKAAWNEAAEAAARARVEAEKNQSIADKIRGRERGRVESVSDVLARAGIVSEAATGKAKAIESRMLRQGFGAEAVRKVLPYAVDESGQQVLTDEEMANLAAMETYGKGQLQFEKPKQMAATLRRARRAATTDAALVAKWRTAIEERQTRLQQDTGRMDYDAMAKSLTEGPEAIPEDQIKQVIEDIRAVAKGEEVSTEGLSMFWSGSDRLIWQTRQREAARRAKALGIISNEEAISAANVEPDISITGFGGPTARQPVVVNNYNHGTINNGKPSTQPVQRAVTP